MVRRDGSLSRSQVIRTRSRPRSRTGPARAPAPATRAPRGAGTGGSSSRWAALLEQPRAEPVAHRERADHFVAVGDPVVGAGHPVRRGGTRSQARRYAAKAALPPSSTSEPGRRPRAVRVLVAELPARRRTRTSGDTSRVRSCRVAGAAGVTMCSVMGPFHQRGGPGRTRVSGRGCNTFYTPRVSDYVHEDVAPEEIERQLALYGPLAQSIRELADASIRTEGVDGECARPGPRSRRSPRGCAGASCRLVRRPVRSSAAGPGQRRRRARNPVAPPVTCRTDPPAGPGRTSAWAPPTRAPGTGARRRLRAGAGPGARRAASPRPAR